MNVLLLRPHYDAHHRPAGFPIGLGYLAAVLERAGHRVRLLDLVLHQRWEDELARTLAAEKFRLLGISCMSVQYTGACRTAAFARQAAPGVPIVMGGAHPSITPEETLRHDFVDFVIRGEGEQPLLNLVETLEREGPLAAVGSLSFKTGGESVHNSPRTDFPEPDELPFPAYHLLPMDRYFQMEIPGFPTRNPNPIQIFTSRGCPYHCIYCHDLFGKRFRPRSPENVVAEMKFLYDSYAVREFLIYDDNFTFDLERARRICRLIIESGMRAGIQFPNGIRADRVDEDLLRLMIAAGTHSVTIGIESGSPKIQELIRKGLRLEKVSAFLRMARGHGLVTLGSFILGFPGETREDIRQTIRFARRSDLDYAFFAFATPYPGTELHRMALDRGLRLHLVDDAMDITTPHIETPELPLRALNRMYLLAYFLFYTRPRRLARLLASLFQPGVLGKYLRGLRKYIFPAIR